MTGSLLRSSSLRLVAFVCFFGLSSCSSLPSLPSSWNPFDSEDDPNQPVELLQIEEEVDLRRLWSVSVGNGQGDNYTVYDESDDSQRQTKMKFPFPLE